MRLGIDIGGTKANILLLDADESIRLSDRVETGTSENCEGTIRRICGRLENMLAQVGLTAKDIAFAGAGVPGTVDPTGSIVVNAPNLGWQNEPVSAYFEKYAGLQVTLVQDTRAAAWAEARKMPERKCVVCVTLGTGIGCGIVLNGHIWHGALGTAGEIGHIPVLPGGRRCNCRKTGCMEAYASGTGLGKTAREREIAEDCQGLFRLAQEGSPAARAAIDEAVCFAAQALTAVVNILSPDALLFSGGLAEQKELFVDPIMRKLKEMAYAQAMDEKLLVGMASLGGNAPAIGAAFLDESEA